MTYYEILLRQNSFPVATFFNAPGRQAISNLATRGRIENKAKRIITVFLSKAIVLVNHIKTMLFELCKHQMHIVNCLKYFYQTSS